MDLDTLPLRELQIIDFSGNMAPLQDLCPHSLCVTPPFINQRNKVKFWEIFPSGWSLQRITSAGLRAGDFHGPSHHLPLLSKRTEQISYLTPLSQSYM